MTRPWLMAKRNAAQWQRDHSPVEDWPMWDGELALFDALIAHCDRYGWPEEPHECKTCGHVGYLNDPPEMYCRLLETWCDTLGHSCGAWTRREP